MHVLDIGLSEASDAAIWEYARLHECVVISKDEDFLYLAGREISSARLVWVRLGNCRRGVLLEAVGRARDRVEAALRNGERVVELR